MVVGKDQREGKRAGNRYDYKAPDVRVKHGGQEEMRQVASSMLCLTPGTDFLNSKDLVSEGFYLSVQKVKRKSRSHFLTIQVLYIFFKQMVQDFPWYQDRKMRKY